MTHPAPDQETEARVRSAVDEVLDEQLASAPTERPPVPAARVAQEEDEPVEPWAEKLVRVLDDAIRVPGTDFRFGLDGILGLIFPSAGDVLTGAGAVSLLSVAIEHRVPTVIIGRMLLNIAVDTLVGSIPIVGDAFDFFWKSNRRNLELIEAYRDDPNAEPSAIDPALVGGAVLLVAVSTLLPLLIAPAIGAGLLSLFD